MRVQCNEDTGEWAISLEIREEAEALLAAQASHIGNRVLSTTDLKIDRITPGRAAIERLRFAESVLPIRGDTSRSDTDVVEFPLPETQHLAGLMFGVVNDALKQGAPVTEFDDELSGMNDRVDHFFGMI